MQRRYRHAVFLAVALCLLADSVWAFPPQRRRDYDKRLPNEYLLVPAVASLPGIGVFVGVIASASNLGDTGIDAGGAVADSIDGSDIRIRAVALRNIPLLIPGLSLEYQFANINLGNLQVYLPGRNSPDFTIPVTAEFDYQMVRPVFRLFERRFNLSYSLGYLNGFDFDENGNEIPFARHTASADLLLDFTDDWVDPRAGLRLGYSTTLKPPKASFFGKDSKTTSAFGGSDDVQIKHTLLNFYIPFTERLNLAWSNQFFAAEGREDSQEVIPGGSPPLRGYPQGRWSDRYGVFMGWEARYTFPMAKKLDILLAHGILEGIQLAAFYELGQVAPHNDNTLYEDMHRSYGFGVRTLFQAIVLRLDLATSDEGPQTHLTIDQPF